MFSLMVRPHEAVFVTAFSKTGERKEPGAVVADGDVVVRSRVLVECLPALRGIRETTMTRLGVTSFQDAGAGEFSVVGYTSTPIKIPKGAQERSTAVQTRFAKQNGRHGTLDAVLSHVPGVLSKSGATNKAGVPWLADPGIFGNGNVKLIATSVVNTVALVLHMIDATPEAAMGVLLVNVNDTRMIVGFVLAILGGGCVYNLGGEARFDSRGPVDDMLGIRKDCDGMATSTCTAVAALIHHGEAVLEELAARSASGASGATKASNPAREASGAREARSSRDPARFASGASRTSLREVAAAVVVYLRATTATAGMAFLKARTPGFGDGHSDLDRTVHDTKACIKPFGHAVAVLVPLRGSPRVAGAYPELAAKAAALRRKSGALEPLAVESTASMADVLVGDTKPSGLVKLLENEGGVYSNMAKEYGAFLKKGEATLCGPDGTHKEARWAEAAGLGGVVTAGSYKMCRPYYPGSYMELWVLYLGDGMVTGAPGPFHAALRKAAKPRDRLVTRSLEHGYERQPCGTVTPHMAALAAARTRRLHPRHPPGELVELGPLPRRRADNAFVVTLSPFDADHIAKAPADRLFAIDALNYALINAPHPGYDRHAAPPAPPPAKPVKLIDDFEDEGYSAQRGFAHMI